MPHQPITWQYIAGFFDGEGCIVPHHASPQFAVKVTQCDEKVIDDIGYFLASHNIVALKYNSKPEWYKFYKKPIFNLHVNYREGSTRFLEHVFPYLRVKKQTAQDALRFMKVYPARQKKGPGKRRDYNLD